MLIGFNNTKFMWRKMYFLHYFKAFDAGNKVVFYIKFQLTLGIVTYG